MFNDVLPEDHSFQSEETNSTQDSQTIVVPPRASAIESAINTLYAPSFQ